MNPILSIEYVDNTYKLSYLGKTTYLRIFYCTGSNSDFKIEVEKYKNLKAPQIAFIPESMLRSRYQILQAVIYDMIYGDKLKIKDPDLRLAMLITGYTQIKKFTMNVIREYEASNKIYYMVLKCSSLEECIEPTPSNCSIIKLDILSDSLFEAVKNLREIYRRIT